MIDQKSGKRMARFAIYSKMGIASFVSILISGIPVIISDLVAYFVDEYAVKRSNITLTVWIVLVAVLLLLTIYLFVAPNVALNRKHLKKLFPNRLPSYLAEFEEPDESEKLSLAIGARATGSLVKSAGNADLGNAISATGTVMGLSAAYKVFRSGSQKAELIAKHNGITVPKAKKRVLAIIFLSVFIVLLAYIPQIAKVVENRDHRLAVLNEACAGISENFENVVVSGLDIYAYSADRDNDVHLRIHTNAHGTIKEILYYIDLPSDRPWEETVEYIRQTAGELQTAILHIPLDADPGLLASDPFDEALFNELKNQPEDRAYFDVKTASGTELSCRYYSNFDYSPAHITITATADN